MDVEQNFWLVQKVSTDRIQSFRSFVVKGCTDCDTVHIPDRSFGDIVNQT